jgi:hypothetical protein
MSVGSILRLEAQGSTITAKLCTVGGADPVCTVSHGFVRKQSGYRFFIHQPAGRFPLKGPVRWWQVANQQSDSGRY